MAILRMRSRHAAALPAPDDALQVGVVWRSTGWRARSCRCRRRRGPRPASPPSRHAVGVGLGRRPTSVRSAHRPTTPPLAAMALAPLQAQLARLPRRHRPVRACASRVTELCDHTIGTLETASACVTASRGAVREVDQDAEPVALLHDRLAELGQAVVLGLLGLEIADRVADVVHELDVADAQVVGRLQLACRSLSRKLAPSTDSTTCGSPLSARSTSLGRPARS